MSKATRMGLRKAGKAVVGMVCACALVVAYCIPASAADGDSMSQYDPPTSVTDINPDYVTIGTHNTGSQAEMLGLTDVTYGVNNVSTYDNCITSNQLGLFGTDLNQAISPYWANYFYNVKLTNDGESELSSSLIALPSGMQKPDSADTNGKDEYGGVSNTVYHRPDILMGCDPASWSTGGQIVLKDSGVAVSVAPSSLASSGYSDQVELVQSFDSSSPYYQDGDENYDPYYVEFTTFYGDAIDGTQTCGAYSLYTAVINMYRLAEAADGVMTANPSKKTRYSESPDTIAEKYESYLRGLQLDVLSAIDSGKTAKKKVAIVSSIDNDAQTATIEKSAPEGTVLADYGDSGNSSISATTEILQNVCNNIAGCAALDGTDPDTDEPTYTWDTAVGAEEIMQADVIFLDSASDEAALKALLADGGYEDESAYPSIFTTSTSLSDSWGNAAGVTNAAQYIGFVYPEVINPVYALAYALTEFWHVSSDTTTLSNVLGYVTQSASFPEGVTTDISGYSAATVENAIQTGLWYYKQNKSSVDKNYPTLTVTSHVTLPTSDPNAKTAPGGTTPKAKAGKQTIKVPAKATVKKGKKTTIKVKGAKTNLVVKVTKKVKKALKVTAKGKKSIIVKALKGAKKGKTYKIKVYAKKSGSYAKSNTKTIKVKIK